VPAILIATSTNRIGGRAIHLLVLPRLSESRTCRLGPLAVRMDLVLASEVIESLLIGDWRQVEDDPKRTINDWSQQS
jgi:hypothetical protein